MKLTLAARVARLEKILEGLELHKSIERFYVDMIRTCAEEEAEAAVGRMLQHPIEMTIEDIEKAFSHKVKIVRSKE